ncbi:MAG: hypothetical protein VX293_06685 [Candidatus Latescibacterota bacterium]|nr:hypothetical protein [Candidatus Latescibacterota bacterium]
MLIRLLALGLCYWSCTERPTQSATPSRSAVRAKLVAQPNTYVVSHGGEEVFRLEALKWRGGRQGAVSLTYDAPWGVDPVFELATDAVMARGLAMDLEIVSTKLQHFKRLPIIERMYRELIPNGIGFFGHGHGHVYHDSLGYTQAYESFRTNFELMEKWGLKPKAYGYPHWSGIQASTQAANRQAGFIAARGGLRRPPRRADFYICSGDVREPDNWFYLPSVIMGAKDGTDIPHHDALIRLLEEALEADAWIILTYHSIGNPEGWGYYPLPEFERDLDYIAAADFWSGNLDAVSAYIQERNALDVKIVRYFGIGTPSQYELTIGDGLDNAVYDEPLTFELSFNPELNVREVHIDPPVDGASSFVVADNRLRLEIVPDERRYALVLERSN